MGKTAMEGFLGALGASPTAELITAFDWAGSGLGPMTGWPAHLRTAVTLVARSPVAMTLLWGPQGTLVYNDGYAAIAGDRHPASLGASALEVWPEVADFNRAMIARVLAGESVSFRDECLVLERNGERAPAWFDLDYSPVCDDAGAPVGVVAVVVETTRRVLLARRLDEERERFNELFDQAPTFMAILRGPQHRIELANPGFTRLIGGRAVVGRTMAQALPDAAAQGYVAQLDEVYRSGKAFSANGALYEVQAAPGGPVVARFLDYVYQPIKGASGAVTGIFVEGVDVSGRVAAETGMRAANAQNRQILDSAIDYAIVAFDREGRITRWNEGARRTLGWTEEEMLGHDGARFFTPEDRAAGRMEKEMAAALATGVGNDERWHLRKNGERFWAHGEMTPLRADDGSVIGFVKVLRDRTEQHRAAEALALSEARLHRAQEAGGVGTFSLDVDTDRLFGTRQFYRIFGLPETESIEASVLESLVIPDDTAVRSSRASRESETASLDVEYRIRRADDQAERWIARKAEFTRGSDGRIHRLVGVVRDITEQRATLQALEDSARQFRTFAEVLPSQVWTAQPDGLLDWFNDQVYAYTGASRGALDGTGWAALVHPDDIGVADAYWTHCLATGESYETEFRILRADGAYRWHVVRALPIRSGLGAIGRWVGTNTDIHERKLAQTASARDLDRIWTLSQELMLICDFEGRITAVNPSAGRLLGWRKEDMVGRPLSDFVHPEDLEATAAEVGKLETGVTTLAFENRYRAQDGSYKLFSWTAVPDGGHIHAVGRDVTRERVAEEGLRQSQKLEAIGHLTGGVAHDFNNVLAVIRTSIDLLRRVPLDDARRERFMNAISDAVTRAAKLTGQLLAFARRQALQPTVFDAGHNTQAVSEMIRSLAGARVEIDVFLAEQVCFVHADPSQFDTALVNLAVNARDAMDNAGRLTITVWATDEIPSVRTHPAVAGKFVAVAVADTGKGIAPEHLQKIFEPFFTTKGVGHGTGLGLSQVFGFAKQSGGDIRVESVPGQGSTFTLYLPRAARPGQAQEVAPISEDIALSDGECILVVEDNPELSASVEQTLQALGYRTVACASAEAALDTLGQGDPMRFAAVFTDVVMAGMSGIELGREVRRRHGLLPVVLTSGYSYVLAQGSDHGFTLLQKPYSLEDVSHVLHEAIHAGKAGYRPRRRPAPHAPALQAERLAETEGARLAALESLGVLDTEEDAAYDELTQLAAKFCQAPIALVSLIDGRRQWFKSRVGLQARETPREHAFCAHAIQEPERVMVVNDATQDPRFAQNPLVTGDPNIRFYAGAPLVTSSGHALGTLCVIDRVPRELAARQLEVLQFLANQVVERLEKRGKK